MSNDPKQPQPTKPSRPEAIAVKLIRFSETVDIPGSQLNGISITGRNPSEKRPGAHHHDLELQPWLRRFRIAYVEGGKSEPSKVSYVHESFVKSYEEW